MPIQLKVLDAVVELVQGSAIDQDVDVIVNAANVNMRGGGGIDGAIHQAAGFEMTLALAEATPNPVQYGEVVVTAGFNLKQSYIIHAAGPRWYGGANNEPELLRRCYYHAIYEADKLGSMGVSSIAFCSIATGIYSYPLDQAAEIAVETIRSFLMRNPSTSVKRVVFAIFKVKEYKVFRNQMVKMGASFGGM